MVDEIFSVEPDSQSAEASQPTDGAFDDPSGLTESTAVRGIALCDPRFDSQPFQQCIDRPIVVGTVGLYGFRFLKRMARLAASGGNVHNQWNDFLNIVAVGSRDAKF